MRVIPAKGVCNVARPKDMGWKNVINAARTFYIIRDSPILISLSADNKRGSPLRRCVGKIAFPPLELLMLDSGLSLVGIHSLIFHQDHGWQPYRVT